MDMLENNIDVAIHSGMLPDSSLIARLLLTSRWIICASPEYLLTHVAQDTPDDLAHHNCLQFTHRTPLNTWPLTTPPLVIHPPCTMGPIPSTILSHLYLLSP